MTTHSENWFLFITGKPGGPGKIHLNSHGMNLDVAVAVAPSKM